MVPSFILTKSLAKILQNLFRSPLDFYRNFAIIMSAEETASRFLPAAVAAQFHKSGFFEPFLWNSAIAAMRISTEAPRLSRGRRRVFG